MQKLIAKLLQFEIVRFGMVGITALSFYFLTAVVLYKMLGAHPLFANTMAVCTAMCISYLGHHHFSFKKTSAYDLPRIPVFIGIAVTLLVLNNGATAYMLHLEVPALIAMFSATAIASLCSFFLNRNLVFLRATRAASWP